MENRRGLRSRSGRVASSSASQKRRTEASPAGAPRKRRRHTRHEEDAEEDEEMEGMDDAVDGEDEDVDMRGGNEGGSSDDNGRAENDDEDGEDEDAGGMMTHASKFTQLLADRSTNVKAWVKDNRPVVTMEQLLARLPSADIEGSWTQEMEDDLRARFEANPLRAYTAKKRNVHNHFWSLWRKTCQLRGVFPTDVIGAREYLEYGDKVEVAKGVWEPDPNWNRSFCEALDFLVVASPCRGDMGLLSLFIRYAVACSIDDRRRVPLDESGWRSPYFRDVEGAIKTIKGRRSLLFIGEQTRRLWGEQGLEIPWEGRVFALLEEQYQEREIEPFNQEEDAEFQLYAVTTNHLKVLIQAFRDVHDLGYAMFSDMDERFKVISNARSGKDAPKNWEDLTKLRLPLLLADMRIREKRLLHAPDRSDLDDRSDDFPGEPRDGGEHDDGMFGGDGYGGEHDDDGMFGSDGDVPMPGVVPGPSRKPLKVRCPRSGRMDRYTEEAHSHLGPDYEDESVRGTGMATAWHALAAPRSIPAATTGAGVLGGLAGALRWNSATILNSMRDD
ncbi:hypothetical protein F5Y00DRAFT_260757 [Daldinia vernicosa]|uniref:uncharacterized protein n=1 Tax=Daldinia vernicosa TaxID=114800 RepID=UPI0020081F29|nr:uncharacterized protein F5Y00DRAFT_260757 [Daldinia vernicosa]KAI0850459.1 hypothetical protein F5Y00DRAFT_260757 [Daldinia vernicosa]